MTQITHTAIGALAAVLVMTGTVAAKPPIAPAKPVALASRPGTSADLAAQRLMAHELWQARRAGEASLVLVATARLGNSEVLFVQIQSKGECGSGGCSTASFKKTNGRWVKILDALGGTIRVADSGHMGMPDLIVKDKERFVWNGSRYS
jgi:hypothetical protein